MYWSFKDLPYKVSLCKPCKLVMPTEVKGYSKKVEALLMKIEALLNHLVIYEAELSSYWRCDRDRDGGMFCKHVFFC